MKVPITFVIPTYNAERQLREALDSVIQWAEEVIIVDSLSSDKTVDIAQEYGLRIVQRPFVSFGDQFSWFLDHLPFKTEWVFQLSQDEVVDASLKDELVELFKTEPACQAYTVRWRFWFMGRPTHLVSSITRLMRLGACRYTSNASNEQVLVNGKLGDLNGILEHKDSLNLHEWNDKHNVYSTMEAIGLVKGTGLATTPKLFGTRVERRMFIKNLFFKVPFRYQILFLYFYLVKGMWRDGKLGWIYAYLRAEVYRMWEYKALEIKLTGVIPEYRKPVKKVFDPRVLNSPLQRQLLPETLNALA